MIKENKFRDINNEIIDSINNCLDEILNKNQGNYIILLANGEYKDHIDNNTKYNPYVIDNMTDIYKGLSRIEFLVEFLKNYYTFKTEIVEDNSYRMSLELMIYTHIWESKPFLKKLFRVAKLIDNEPYEWKVVVPEMSKFKFIIDEIRNRFDKNNLNLGNVIKKGFHTSLRNAFAHSEYSFNTLNSENSIRLHNFKDAYDGELEKISFDDWSERFAYSVLLSYNFEYIIAERRKSILVDLGTKIFTIDHPNSKGTIEEVKIIFDSENNRFAFVKNVS